jgi:hypothetical protein
LLGPRSLPFPRYGGTGDGIRENTPSLKRVTLQSRFPLKARQRPATNHTIFSSVRFSTSKSPITASNFLRQHLFFHPIQSLPFHSAKSLLAPHAAPALTPCLTCLKWVRRIAQRSLPLLTSLHSSLLISPTLLWTRISPFRDDLILNLVRLSLLPYLHLHLHLFQIVPLSFFYDH